jgi:hypothetical protein
MCKGVKGSGVFSWLKNKLTKKKPIPVISEPLYGEIIKNSNNAVKLKHNYNKLMTEGKKTEAIAKADEYANIQRKFLEQKRQINKKKKY